MDPSERNFVRYTHLEPTMFASEGRGTNSHVLLARRAEISSSMAASHSGLLAADLKPFGSVVETRAERRSEERKVARSTTCRGRKIPVLERVTMGWPEVAVVGRAAGVGGTVLIGEVAGTGADAATVGKRSAGTEVES